MDNCKRIEELMEKRQNLFKYIIAELGKDVLLDTLKNETIVELDNLDKTILTNILLSKGLNNAK